MTLASAPVDTVFRAYPPSTSLDLLSPNPADIRLADIATSLSRIVRFNGRTRSGPWYVADHCRLMESTLPAGTDPLTRLRVLMSDAHEAYIGNLVTPVKTALAILSGGNPFAHLCSRVQLAIDNAAGLLCDRGPGDHSLILIKLANRLARAIEDRDLLAEPGTPWDAALIDEKQCAAMALPDNERTSRSAFLYRFNRLAADAAVTPMPSFLS